MNRQHNLTIDTDAAAPTVDGQASVDRGDHLTLLDDTNSYWWLVKVLKSEEVVVVENVQKSVIDDNLIADVQIKNKKVLDMEEKEENEKELVTEDENFSNSPIENIINYSTPNNFVSINDDAITTDSPIMGIGNDS
ncbi:7256_t:CDS:2 [Entrophospora sp. SA101]|nr:7256_t:CDS:2 [Entrophospora sp. SA101]